MFLVSHPSGEQCRTTGGQRLRALIVLVSALICLTNGNIDSSIDAPTHASVANLLENENGAGEDVRIDRQGLCAHYDSALACVACSTGTSIRMTDCCLDLNAYETCENLLNRADAIVGEGYQGNDWESEDVDENTEQGEDQGDLEEAKRRSPFLGKRRSPFLGKRRAPFLGKRRSPFLGKRRSPFLGKRSGGTPFYNNYYEEKRGRSAFLGKRRSPFLGKRFVVYPNEF